MRPRRQHLANAIAAALDRFVDPDKAEFVGKTALRKRMSVGLRRKLVSLRVGCEHAPAHGGASLMQDGQVVGTITSGDWGHRVGMNLAYAFVDPEFSDIGQMMHLDLCGELVPVGVIEPSPYDPDLSLVLQ